MKVFVAIQRPEIVEAFYNTAHVKLNVLISYFYLRQGKGKFKELEESKNKNMINSLYLDSGAYTAYEQGNDIDIDDYLAYLKRTATAWDEYFNLDSDFDNPEYNLSNQKYLEERLSFDLKKPLPVIHDKYNPFDEFKMYVEDYGHTYIGIGSDKDTKGELLDKVKEDYPNIKIHMFGDLNEKRLMKYNPYSADAATFRKCAGQYKILYWDDINKKGYTICIEDRENLSENGIAFNKFWLKQELKDFLWDKFKYEKKDLLVFEEKRKIVNLYYYTQLEERINQSS